VLSLSLCVCVSVCARVRFIPRPLSFLSRTRDIYLVRRERDAKCDKRRKKKTSLSLPISQKKKMEKKLFVSRNKLLQRDAEMQTEDDVFWFFGF